MSFYGNITNTSRTHFQFDRIYANRYEMENSKNEDGIYAGRFVLVEYDSQMHMDSFLRVHKIENVDGVNYFYTMASGEDTAIERLLTKGTIHKDTIVYTSIFETDPGNGYYVKSCTFYKCTSDYKQNSTEPATFIEIVDGTEETDYITNHAIDERIYGRGYDSTVWQKVYAGGREAYMMIAELNTVVPVFELTVDAPTQTPVVPHFDINSSDIYYKLHQQPSWGMRVRSANLEEGPTFTKDGETTADTVAYTENHPNNLKSDENVIWTRDEYNTETGEKTTLYWHSNDQVWRTYKPHSSNQVQGAIYYNKAGFNPAIMTHDTGDDFIKVEPTGISGRQYNVHQGVPGDLEPQPDIQEISIMLPSLGDSVAQMWDMIYGEGEAIEEGGPLYRNLDVNWDSTEGLRMVKEDTELHGFSYNTEQVSTLAGAINSVHDLMGMIIKVPEGLNGDIEEYASSADRNTIYYYQGKYYRQGIKYEYDEDNIITNRILTEDELKNLVYKPVEGSFTNFPQGLYYGTPNVNYKVEDNNINGIYYPTKGRVYYRPKDTKKQFFSEIEFEVYDPEIHYLRTEVKDSNNASYYIYSNKEDAPNKKKEYCQFILEKDVASGDILPISGKPYVDNMYYIYTNDEGVKGADINPDDPKLLQHISLANEFNINYKYYDVIADENNDVKFILVNLFFADEKYCYYDIENNQYIQCYVKDGKGLVPNADKLNFDTVPFYQITINTLVENFYYPGAYYTTKDNKEYSIYIKTIPEEELTYYARLSDNEIEEVDLSPYYMHNSYYYQLDNLKFIIDRNFIATAGRQYYTKDKILYVYEDSNDLIGRGSEWNISVTNIPESIKLTTRKEIPTMIELEGFARELNTVHGLILKINNLLLINDAHTRDLYTAWGTMNALNDIIAKFEIIAPRQFMIVDDYGRVHSAPYYTDNWIDIQIDGNVLEPTVTITHEIHKVNDTTSESSQNETGSTGTINLYTPIVDERGHIVGKNIETVELPHNFKSISINETKVYANNHLANFNLNDGDRWINLSANADTDTILISHANAGGDTTTSYSTNDTPLFGKTFKVPTVTYDTKGHITTIVDHTVKLPTIGLSVASGNVLTGATLDLTKQNGSLAFTAANIGTLPLVGYTRATAASEIAATDTLNSALGKLEYRVEQLTSSVNKKAEKSELQSLITRIATLESKVK